ncbi:hypothetical protein RUND412_007027 [Rhizina undulata]
MAICRLRFFDDFGDELKDTDVPLNPNGDGMRTSYYVFEGEQNEQDGRVGGGRELVVSGPRDGEDGAGAIAAIHVEPSGSHFLESLNPLTPITISRVTSDSSIPPHHEVPVSTLPKERIFILLDSNTHIYINSSKLLFEASNVTLQAAIPPPRKKGQLFAPAPTDADTDNDEGPQIQVAQSMQEDSSSTNVFGALESTFQESMPFIPDTLQDEPEALKTPKTQSRHIDFDSLGQRQSRDPELTPLGRARTASKLFASSVSAPTLGTRRGTGEAGNTILEDADETASEDEATSEDDPALESNYFKSPTHEPRPVSIDRVSNTPEAELIDAGKNVAPVANMGAASPSINPSRNPQSASPAMSTSRPPVFFSPDTTLDDISSTNPDLNEIEPDTLPEAFKYKAQKAITTQKTYSRKKRKAHDSVGHTPSPPEQPVSATQGTAKKRRRFLIELIPEGNEDAEMEDEHEPLITRSKGKGRSRKATETKPETPNPTNHSDSEHPAVTNPKQRKPRTSRTPAAKAKSPFEPEDPPQSASRYSPEEKPKRTRQPAAKKPAAAKKYAPSKGTQGDEVNAGETQYTPPDHTQLTPAAKRRQSKTPTTAKRAPRRRKSEATTDAETEIGDAASQTLNVRTTEEYMYKNPVVAFSNSTLDSKKDIIAFLRAHGAKKVDQIVTADILIVGPGELKRTPKLTISVALGKYVVEEKWLLDSKAAGCFLDPEKYIPLDTPSVDLPAAIARGRNGENAVLKDLTVYITSALLSQLKGSKQEESLVEMLRATGAGNIVKKAPRGEVDSMALVLGAEGDVDAAALEKAGWRVYGTGVVGGSVLRGGLELGDEWRVKADGKGDGKGRRRSTK